MVSMSAANVGSCVSHVRYPGARSCLLWLYDARLAFPSQAGCTCSDSPPRLGHSPLLGHARITRLPGVGYSHHIRTFPFTSTGRNTPTAILRSHMMKLTHIIYITGLFVLGATEALRNDTNVKRETPECRWHRRSLNARDDSDDSDSEDDFCFGLQPADDALWHAAKCKGAKLLFGTTQNAPEAARFVNPINSPWDGEMRHELAEWGWKDGVSDPDTECNVDFLKTILGYLRTTTGSHLYGGPNYCFSVKHCDSDAILKDENGNMPPRNDQYYDYNGRLYRVSSHSSPSTMSQPPANLIDRDPGHSRFYYGDRQPGHRRDFIYSAWLSRIRSPRYMGSRGQAYCRSRRVAGSTYEFGPSMGILEASEYRSPENLDNSIFDSGQF